MNLIIENIEIKSLPFENINDVNKYRFLSKTSQSKFISKQLKDFIKIVDKTTVYYYNKNTKLWVNVDEQVYINYMYDLFDETAKKIKKIKKADEEIDEEVIKYTNKLIELFDTKNYMNDIIDRIYSRLLDSNFIVKLDSQPYYFPIRNGKKINLKTLATSERTINDYFTYESLVDYIPGELPNAEKFFNQVMPNKENREYFRKVLGYSLTIEMCARVFFIWYGKGSNGKSKVAKLLELILNKQYHQCDKSIFIKTGKSSKGCATPETMDLINRRMSVYSEGETSDKIEMNMAGIKAISGEDPISGRHLYGNQITFRSYTKLHMLTNFTPPTNAEVAIKERLRYIFLDSQFVNNPDPKNKNQFKIDKDFTDKLETVYLSEIFSWIARGAKEFYKDNKIEMSPEFEKRTEDILSSEDSIKTFIDRKLKITNDLNDKITKSELFQAYNNFCSENSQRCQPRSTLFNRLEHMNFKLYTLNGYDIYRGLIVVDCKDEVELIHKDPKDLIIEQLREEIEKLKQELKEKPKKKKPVLTDDDLEKELELLMK